MKPPAGRRWLSRELTVLLSIALTILAVTALSFFWRLAERGHERVLLLERLEAAIQSANALEWQAVRDDAIDPAEREQLERSVRQTRAVFAELDPAIRASPEMQEIERLIARYSTAVRQEMSPVRGRRPGADQIDESLVDPTLAQLHSRLEAAIKVHERLAEAASRNQIVGSLAAILISWSLITLLSQRLRKFQLTQLAAEAAMR